MGVSSHSLIILLLLCSLACISMSYEGSERKSGHVQTLYKERLKHFTKSRTTLPPLIVTTTPPQPSRRLHNWRTRHPLQLPSSSSSIAKTKQLPKTQSKSNIKSNPIHLSVYTAGRVGGGVSTTTTRRRPEEDEEASSSISSLMKGEPYDQNENQSGTGSGVGVWHRKSFSVSSTSTNRDTKQYIPSSSLPSRRVSSSSSSPKGDKMITPLLTSSNASKAKHAKLPTSASSSSSSPLAVIDIGEFTPAGSPSASEDTSMGPSGQDSNVQLREMFGAVNLMGGILKREIWTIPLSSISVITIFLIAFFEIYVLCKVKSSRSNLFLGQFLLFGLFLCSSLSLIFAVCPSVAGCYTARIGFGLAYTIIFSVLMVKCVFLISLEHGNYLPASYQASLLFFSVLVQVVINIQWVISYPPGDTLKVSVFGGPLWSQCGGSFGQLLLTMSYNIFLIMFVGILAFRARKIRENYREAVYVGFSILITIPIWAAWMLSAYFLQYSPHLDACLGFGMVAQSLSVFLIMFLPKGRQLAAMGKEGMFIEDQEDQCSGYSPSFFHFKPAKVYKSTIIGDGNVYTTLEPTLSTLNPNVFFHRTDFHPGMIY